jgi:hypothetical protein
MGYAKTFEVPSYGISTQVLASADVVEAVTWVNYAKSKEFTLIQDIYPTVYIRCSCEIKNLIGTIFYLIYLNGVSTGKGGSVTASDFTLKESDHRFDNLKRGDKIQFYTKSSDINGWIQNIRLCGVESPFLASTF